ncbi:MAG: hypothetical protein ABUK01_07310 [Leptospirales bacterium]
MLTFKKIIIIIMLSLFYWGCDWEDAIEVEYSLIQPRPPLVPNSETIDLKLPLHLSPRTRGTAFDFTFKSSMVAHAALLIFTAEPSANTKGLRDVSGICLGGATSMAPGHTWDDLSLHWDNVGAQSAVYVCDGSNRSEPLSTSTKVAFDGTLAAGTYYWAVLGYDKFYRITHSSPLYTLTIN